MRLGRCNEAHRQNKYKHVKISNLPTVPLMNVIRMYVFSQLTAGPG